MSRSLYYVVTTVLGILMGIALICVMMPPEADARMKQLAVVFWGVVPPIWLFAEDYFMKKNLTPDNLEYKHLKDQQVAAFRLWTGFAMVIALLFLK